MFIPELVWRYVRMGKRLFSLNSIMSIVGLSLGVSCLLVAMAGFSGFKLSLEKSIIDMVGHVSVLKRRSRISEPEMVEEKIRRNHPEVEHIAPFAQLEGEIAGKGKIAFVQLQGFEPRRSAQVLNIDNRITKGKVDLAVKDGVASALVGEGIFKKFKLEIGQIFAVVLPNPDPQNAASFQPTAMRFRVSGVVDMGKHSFNNRVVITNLKSVQEFGNMEGRVSGFRMKISDKNQAEDVSYRVTKTLGFPFWSISWRDIDKNLFSAIDVEKYVIFFVMLIIVLVAAFNVSTSLYVTVLRRYHDISIFKTLGMPKAKITLMFVMHGLIVGMIGIFIGTVLGVALCEVFEFVQSRFELMPGKVYRLDNFQLIIKFMDLVLVVFASIVICFLSTLVPAIRGAGLDPVEGLRYE